MSAAGVRPPLVFAEDVWEPKILNPRAHYFVNGRVLHSHARLR